MQRDSAQYTLLMAAALCAVCSVFVAGSAIMLRPIQEANSELDRQKNVLLAAHLVSAKDATAAKIKETFEGQVERELIDLTTGKATTPEQAGVGDDFDPAAAANDSKLGETISAADDVAGIKRRAKYAWVYKVKNDAGQLQQIVLPIYGKGLWSTVYGFLAVKSDGTTVSGITFYKHGETPGLGGEVENPKWQALWVDKTIYVGDDVKLAVAKGAAATTGDAAKHEVDGLSGATITSRGVSNMIQYWLGPQGFGPYLQSLAGGSGSNSDG